MAHGTVILKSFANTLMTKYAEIYSEQKLIHHTNLCNMFAEQVFTRKFWSLTKYMGLVAAFPCT